MLVEEESLCVTKNVEVTVGAVIQNVSKDPPLIDAKATRPLPLGPYVGAEKSLVRAIATPSASRTETVQEITSAKRTYVVPRFACPRHDNVELDDADDTLNENGLLERTANPRKLSFSVIRNADVMTAGAVTRKLNEDPPFAVVSVTTPLPLGPYVGTRKSLERQEDWEGTESWTVTVHEMISLTRTTVVD